MIPSIIGNRLVQDINVDFLDESAIPRGLLLVSDGRIGKSSHGKLKTFFEERKGKNHNRFAIIEAMTPRENAILEGSGRVQIQWVPLRDAQRDDHTFSKYADSNSDKIGETFRIPPLLRGKVKDFNRATALASLEYAEEQVFEPERDTFDALINRTLVADLGIRFWRMRSRGPRKHDPETQAKVAEVLLKSGVVVPQELRGMAEHALGVDLLDSAQPWMRYPMPMLLAGHVQPAAQDGVSEDHAATPADDDGDQDRTEKSDAHAIGRELLKLEARLRQVQLTDQARLVTALANDEAGE
jgi:capsid portal protein